MTRRLALFVVLAVVVAAECIHLGIWQLSRRAERRAYNARVRARLSEPEADATTLPVADASQLRRARVRGTLDYDHELVVATQVLDGSPGVNLLTPMRIPGRDTALLINRGWVYAPDGMTVDRPRWRDTTSEFEGFVLLLADSARDARSAFLEHDSRLLRRLDRPAVAASLPYPVSRLYLVATNVDSSVATARRIARLRPPPLDEGPHLSYAIQWFAFAAIALGGSLTVAFRRSAEQHVPPAPPLAGEMSRFT